MTVGSRNPSKLTSRRVGVCVICTKNITLQDAWKRINRPAMGKAHVACIPKEVELDGEEMN